MSNPVSHPKLFRSLLLVLIPAFFVTLLALSARPAAGQPAAAAVPVAPQAQPLHLSTAARASLTDAAHPAPQPVPTAPSAAMSLAARPASANEHASPSSLPETGGAWALLALAAITSVLAAGLTARRPHLSPRVALYQ